MFITINNISAIEDFSVEHKEDREPKINIDKTKFIINTYQIVDISSRYLFSRLILKTFSQLKYIQKIIFIFIFLI